MAAASMAPFLAWTGVEAAAAVILGLVVLAPCIVVVALMLERQPLSYFVSLATRNPPAPGPYAATMNSLAAKEGWQAQGVYECTKGGRYRFRAWVWLSPRRETLALICDGNIRRLRVRKTRLLTRTASSGYLLTSDEVEVDLGGLCMWNLLSNADFSELWRHHQGALREARITPLTLAETQAIQHYQAFEAASVRRMVEHGYARFRDPAQTWWHYTLKGAVKWLPACYAQLLRPMGKQRSRTSLPRPGDAAYERRVQLDSDLPANIRFSGSPARFRADSPHLLLFDPLVLDALGDYFAQRTFPADAPTDSMLDDLNRLGPLRVGYYRIEPFEPGDFEIAPADFASAVEAPAAHDWFCIDSGTVLIADYARLARFVQVLSWERYDSLLQSPLGDNSRYDAVAHEVSGPYYAILSGNADTPFAGDGTYRLRPGAIRRVGPTGPVPE